MSDVIDQSSFRFQFNITIEDDRSFRKLAGKRLKVHVNREALQVQALIIWAVVVVAGLLAMALEWAAAQILSALLVGFVLGQIYAFFLAWQVFRQIQDNLFEVDRVAQMTWHVTLDDSSIVVRTPASERRTSWHSIQGVTDTPTMVAIWYNSGYGFFIPARAFFDPSARAAFVEWVSERLRSATASSSAINPPNGDAVAR